MRRFRKKLSTFGDKETSETAAKGASGDDVARHVFQRRAKGLPGLPGGPEPPQTGKKWGAALEFLRPEEAKGHGVEFDIIY